MSNLNQTPVAIIGMSSVFADAKNLEKYWENIIAGIDCIREIPETRWKIEDYYDPDPKSPDKTYCKVGGFLPDINFNPLEFGLPPNILEVTDVSQLLSLAVARDALIDAGYDPNASDGKFTAVLKERTGVILGVGGGQKLITPLTSRLQYPVWKKALASIGMPEAEIESVIEKIKTAYIPWTENSFPGMLGNVISGRIANRFDLGGINSVVDAACAASLSATKMALSELIEGRCDMMITGGVDTDNSPFMYMSFSKTPAFSAKGSIRPFDHESDGMLIGEGIGMIVCKRLDDAIRDGDRIYATINGMGGSSDGKFKSIYAPRPQGQALAMQRAYDESGYDAATVGLIEAHGTGTNAGDLSEITSTKTVFEKNDQTLHHIALGSVKSQIGHTKAAAGIAGLIKTALALHHKILPGTINVTKPNPKLGIENSPLYVNTESRPWFRKSTHLPRRAGVSAFGFGGVNLHVTLEEYTQEEAGAYRRYTPFKLLLIHATSEAALRSVCTQHISELSSDNAANHFLKLANDSKQTKIPSSSPRIGFVSSSIEETIEKLHIAQTFLTEKEREDAWSHPLKGIWYRKNAAPASDKVVALFSGQGSQYVNMGKELSFMYPTVRESFYKANAVFEANQQTPLTDFVYPIPVFDDDERQQQQQLLTQTQNAQSAIGALSAGMYRLLSNAGFTADFFAGHSYGELTALWAAGVLDDDTFYNLSKARGDAMATPPVGEASGMLAIMASVEDVQPLLASYPEITISNVNSSSQVIVGGPIDALNILMEDFDNKGFNINLLSVSAAFHTKFVEHAQQPFSEAIEKATFHKVTKKIFSNVTGQAYPDSEKEQKNILSQHILKPVLFQSQIEQMYKDGGRIFVEFGPKNILSGLVHDILQDRPHQTISINPNALKNSDEQLREAIVQLAVHGIEVQKFDCFEQPMPPSKPIGTLNFRLNGANYVSDKTQHHHKNLIQMNDTNLHQISSESKINTDVLMEKKIADNEMTDHSTLHSILDELKQLSIRQEKIEKFLESFTSTTKNITTTNQSAEVAPKSNGHAKIFSNGNGVATSRPVPAAITVAPAIETATSTPDPVATTVASVTEIATPKVTENGAVASMLLEVIAEKTGYPSEMLELNMDMEADLGIDSIKRMEIFGAMTQANPSIQGLKPNELAELRTLQQIVDHVSAKIGQNGVATLPPAPAATTVAPVTETATSTPDPVATTVASITEIATPKVTENGAVASILLEVIAEKTGYPSEMLELNMDMEADLGIDSIKRMEIFGAMTQANPSIQGLKPNELAELRTLQQIVDHVSARIGGNGVATSVANLVASSVENTVAPVTETTISAPDPVATTVAPVTETATPKVTENGAVASMLLEVIAEKTGYPSEMLELNMDMEADLGIDSIKRMEIFGAMTQANPSIQGLKPNELAELRTLQQIVDHVSAKIGQNGVATLPPAPAATTVAPVTETATSTPDPVATTVASVTEIATPKVTENGAVASMLLEVIAEKTGYPSEMLELNMDMEADLGIDSIKRMEIFGAMTQANPSIQGLKPNELAELRTLQQIVDHVSARIGKNGSTTTDTVKKKPEYEVTNHIAETLVKENFTSFSSGTYPNVPRASVKVRCIPEPDQLVVSSEGLQATLVTNDGTSLSTSLCNRLLNKGHSVTLLTLPETLIPKNLNKIPDGVLEIILPDTLDLSIQNALRQLSGAMTQLIYLHPHTVSNQDASENYFDTEKEVLKTAFLLAKHAKKELNTHQRTERTAFITVTRMDGAFGTKNATASTMMAGGLFGLTKSLNLEWPTVFCRAIDIVQDMEAGMAAEKIEKELFDANRCLTETAYCENHKRYTIDTELMPVLNNQQLQSSITSKSVFLVTGGAKGITADCVKNIAATFKCKFVLIGRTTIETEEPTWAHDIVTEKELKQKVMEHLMEQGEKPHPLTVGNMVAHILSQREIRENLRFIEAQGAKVMYEAADITDIKAIKAIINKANTVLGPITDVIHGAGRLADKLIENKSSANFDTVFDVKVNGMLTLMKSLSLHTIKNVVLFSSVAGFYGNIGQTDYAIANEVLNKAAYYLKKNYANLQVVAINWGAWDAGMVSPELKKIFKSHNVSLVPTKEGVLALIDQMSTAFSGQQQVLLGGTLPMAKASVEGELTTYKIVRHLVLEQNPFLEHHVIKGHAVMPISVAAAWMAQSAKDMYPGFYLVKVEGVKLFKGIVFDGAQPEHFEVSIKELEKNTGSIRLLVKITSDSGRKLPINHYQTQVVLSSKKLQQPVVPTIDLEELNTTIPEVSTFYQNGFLFHGPDFQGVQQVLELSEEKIVLLCRHPGIPLERQGQFLVKDVNGFLVDIMYQGILIWVRTYKSSNCLPHKMEQIEVYENLPLQKAFCVAITVSAPNEFTTEGDVTAFDPHTGNVYLISRNAGVTINKELQWV